jgi:hypothetical protein
MADGAIICSCCSKRPHHPLLCGLFHQDFCLRVRYEAVGAASLSSKQSVVATGGGLGDDDGLH